MLMNPMLPEMYKMIYKVRGHWYTCGSENCWNVKIIWLCIVYFLPRSKHGFFKKWRNKGSKFQNQKKKSKIVFSSDYETAVVWRIWKDIFISWYMTLAKNSFVKILHSRTYKNIVTMSVLLIFLSYHFKWKKCSFLGQYLNDQPLAQWKALAASSRLSSDGLSTGR